MKKIIRLTESDLHKIVKEAVYDTIRWHYPHRGTHTTVEDGIRKQTEKHRAESAKRRAERNNDKGLETENTIISEVEGGDMGGGFAPGVNTTFGINANGTSDSTNGVTYSYNNGKKKDPAYNHNDMIRKSFEGEGRVGH